MMWLGLDRVHQIGKLYCILNEEDRYVVANNIPVPFRGVKLDGKSPNITHCVGRSAFTGHSRESHEYRRAGAHRLKRRGFGEVRQRIICLEVAMRGRTACMHDAFGNTLVIKVRDFLAQDKIFQQRGPSQTGLE